MLRSDVSCHVLVDFDGTIATVDTTDALLEQFALPEWHAIEEAWKSGAIGSRECMLRQVDLLRATPEALDAFVAAIEIDAGVAGFISQCDRRGLQVTVVSDGLDRTVLAVLARHGIAAPVRANRLVHRGNDRWQLTFPHARDDCGALSGNCKCATPDRAKPSLHIVVGDGRSDFCVAEQADFVLAKNSLVVHARSKSLPHETFTTFAEAGQKLWAWLDGPIGAELPVRRAKECGAWAEK